MPKFLTHLDMMNNEIRNMKIETRSSAPINPVEGQMYFDTTDKVVYVYIDGSWKDISSADVTLAQLAQNTGASSIGVTPISGINGDNVQELLEGLKTYVDSSTIKKFTQDIGDGTSTDIVVTHNLGTRDVVVSVYENSAPYSVVNTNVEITDDNTITVKFTTAPTNNQYRVVVIG
jgi:hypothetical protein